MPSAATGNFTVCTDCHRPERASAFSLVELLATIAVIAVLAALLLPALTAARQRARKVNCISNLHQVGIALQTYLAETRCFPLATSGDGLGEWQRDLRAGATDQILYCPQEVAAAETFLQYFPTNSFINPHYGYNATGSVEHNPPPRNLGLGGDFVFQGLGGGYVAAKENWVVHPARTIAAGDSPALIRPPLTITNLTPADPIYLAFPFTNQVTGFCGVGNWHGNGANMLFCDGHVEYAKQSFWMDPGDASKRLWNADDQAHP